ncbi:MAG: TetR/AcrR family transcriptional regulator [Pseudonocardiaceae bacterium]
MGRQAKFSEEGILDATLRLVSARGPAAATISALGELLGAPVGSIYHRFASRDLVLAALWLRTVHRFQEGFLTALAGKNLQSAAVDTALHTVRWSREDPDQARVLLLYRREDLAARWPVELGTQLASLNAALATALRSYATRLYGRDESVLVRRVTLALVDLPYAATRRHLLAGEPPPPELDDLVAAACRCLLADETGHDSAGSLADVTAGGALKRGFGPVR